MSLSSPNWPGAGPSSQHVGSSESWIEPERAGRSSSFFPFSAGELSRLLSSFLGQCVLEQLIQHLVGCQTWERKPVPTAGFSAHLILFLSASGSTHSFSPLA